MGSTIVCAVDGDDAESRRALLVADDLAPRLGRPAVELEEVRGAARRRVEQLPARCGVDGAQVEVALHPSVDDGFREIAAARDAELLTVGSRGRGSLHAALLGSTSHALAADAPCPVVVCASE